MFRISQKGDFKKTEKFLEEAGNGSHVSKVLQGCGLMGVNALASASPKDSGLTAASWGYDIETSNAGVKITWTNSNENQGVNIALIYQYGHGTGTGGYVQGSDYINPAIKPVFDKISDIVWEEVTKG